MVWRGQAGQHFEDLCFARTRWTKQHQTLGIALKAYIQIKLMVLAFVSFLQ
jgi:hypothetical protein